MRVTPAFISIVLVSVLDAHPAPSGRSQEYRQQQGQQLQERVKARHQQTNQYAPHYQNWALSRVLIPPPPPQQSVPHEDELALARSYFTEQPNTQEEKYAGAESEEMMPELSYGEKIAGPLPVTTADSYYLSFYPRYQQGQEMIE